MSIGAGASAGGDEMQIDSQGMPDHIVEKVNNTYKGYVSRVNPLLKHPMADDVFTGFLLLARSDSLLRIGLRRI